MLSLEEAGDGATATPATTAAAAATAAADSAAAAAATAAAADWHSGGAVQQLLEELAQNVDLISSAETSRHHAGEGERSPHMSAVPNASTGEDQPEGLLP
jgi:hypothetical protein